MGLPKLARKVLQWHRAGPTNCMNLHEYLCHSIQVTTISSDA